jgi:hypothetical protein
MVALLPGLLVSAIALGFILPILAKVFRYGFMTKVDVGFYTFGGRPAPGRWADSLS